LIGLGCFCNCHYSMFFLFFTCFHIVICHSIICAKLSLYYFMFLVVLLVLYSVVLTMHSLL
jgi:hypothetical protein